MHTHLEHPARSRQAIGVMVGLMLPWLISAGNLFGVESHQTAPGLTEHSASFVLMVHEDRISLKAWEASLKAIVEELGRQLHIEVVARLPAAERVTVTFERLSLEEAIQRLRQHAKITYTVKDAEKRPLEITTLLVLPKQEGVGASGSVATASNEGGNGQVTAVQTHRRQEDGGPHDRPAPFKFQFDPLRSLPNER